MRIPQVLVLCGVGIAGVLGLAHLVYTFVGDKLHPRDPALMARMREVPLRITRQTSMWRAWIGFNASHSLGLLLLAAVYGDLVAAWPDVLFSSWLLQGLGAAALGSYMAVARAYWFRVPLVGMSVALGLYIAAILLPHLSKVG